MNLYEFLYSVMVHISLMTLIYIILIAFLVYYIYSSVIEYWFTKNGEISYEFFMNYAIQKVSKGNYFMNYGLWSGVSSGVSSSTENLYTANKALVSYMLEKSGVLDKKDAKILDVGCGYGEQDFFWMSKLDKTNTLKAVDISAEQIKSAAEKCKRSDFASRLSFEVCDAMLLKSKFNDGEFDTVLSVESAFHYSNRPQFFQHVHDILKSGGTFVISDIVINDSYKPGILNSSFLRTFSDFLHVPSVNHVKSAVWEKTIKDSGLAIVECIDITDKTFNPYYKHFFDTYAKNNGLPPIIGSSAYKFLEYVQPFSYKIAVCKKD